jgi:hypothetical protein
MHAAGHPVQPHGGEISLGDIVTLYVTATQATLMRRRRDIQYYPRTRDESTTEREVTPQRVVF